MASVQVHFTLLLLSFSGACLAHASEESILDTISPFELDPNMNALDADFSELKWHAQSPPGIGLTEDEQIGITEHLSVAENKKAIEFEGSKFTIHDILEASWEEAEEMCNKFNPGGHLAVLNNMNVVNFLSKTVSDLKIKNDLWVGGRSNGSRWLWAHTNETIPLWFEHGEYPPWMYVPGTRDQGCILLTPAVVPCTACNARFKEHECQKKHNFICQTDYNARQQELFPSENTTASSTEEESPSSNEGIWWQMTIDFIKRMKDIISTSWSDFCNWFAEP